MKHGLTFLLGAIALLVLAGCTGIPGPSVNLSVYVEDQSGNPVENASVNLYSNVQINQNTNMDWKNISGTVSAGGQTDQDGRFETSIPAGQYSVQAGKENANGTWVYNGVTETFTDSYESVTIQLNLDSNPSGTVYDAPIGDQEVVLDVGDSIRAKGSDGADYTVLFSDGYSANGINQAELKLVDSAGNIVARLTSDGEKPIVFRKYGEEILQTALFLKSIASRSGEGGAIKYRIVVTGQSNQTGTITAEAFDYQGINSLQGVEITLRSSEDGSTIETQIQNGQPVTFKNVRYGTYILNASPVDGYYYYAESKTVEVGQPSADVNFKLAEVKGVMFTIQARDKSYGNPAVNCPDKKATAVLMFSGYGRDGHSYWNETFTTTQSLRDYNVWADANKFFAWSKDYPPKIDLNMTNDCYVANPATGHDVNVGKVSVRITADDESKNNSQDITEIFAYRILSSNTTPVWEVKQPFEQSCSYTQCLHYPASEVTTSSGGGSGGGNSSEKDLRGIASPIE